MNIYSIYKATNTINNKVYIGFDSNWPSRKNDHYFNHTNVLNPTEVFYRALKKYGWNNFRWEVIYQSPDREHTLKRMESYFILEHNSYVWNELSNGYNMTYGGEGPIGMKHSLTTRKKHSEITTQYHNTLTKEERIERSKNCSKGQKVRYADKKDSDYTKYKKRKAHQGQYIIISPLGEKYYAYNGLKEFSEMNNIGVSYWQLFAAYRRNYSQGNPPKKRKNTNEWIVKRIDKKSPK